jgi:predicted NBD/HSP70 family sugar kinase
MAVISNQLYVKRTNTLTVLDLIAKSRGVSRTQLSDVTELSPASVTRIVGQLISLGLVREEGIIDRAQRGRKARILKTNEDGLYSIGVCAEQDRILVSLIDFHHNFLFRAEAPLPAGDPVRPLMLATLVKTLMIGIDRSIIADWSRVRVAGVSVPGFVDGARGLVIKSDQLGWADEDLRTPFERALGIPVWIENDAKACLIGEQARMNIRQEDTAYLLLGTGVGSAVMSNGKLIRGHRNMAGEIEHLNLMPGLLPEDVLQAHLAERGILQSAQIASPSVKTLDDLLIAYRQNAGFARILVEDVLQYLRLVLSMIDSFYDPRRIILGGTTARKLQEALGPLFKDERLSVGGDYEAACMLGASIGAVDSALDVLLNEQDNQRS